MSDLSKVKVKNVTYDIKDAKARADLLTLLGSHALEALKKAAWLDDLNDLADLKSADEGKLPNAKAVVDYVESMIETIPEFDVVIDTLGSDGKPATPAGEATFHKIYLCPASSPAQPNLYMEWITIRSGTSPNYTYTWEKIGDTSMDLSTYVQKTTTIAGVDLQDNITKTELQTALELGEFAYADEGEVSVPTQTVSNLTATGKFTPTLTGALAETSTAATLTKTDLTPAGTNASSSVTFTGGSTATVSHQTATGSLPSLTGQSYTAPTLGNATTSAFATEGVTATVGTGDDAETLIIATASTDDAVTAQGTFSAGNVNFGTFSAGALPTFEDVTVVDDIGTGTAAAQVFTGTKIDNALVTAVNYDKTTIGTLAINEVNATLDVDDVVIPAQNDLTVTPKASV